MYDEIPRREKFSLFSAKTFFLQKTWHHLSTWDAPHIWLHHGVHLLADMKAAISDTPAVVVAFAFADVAVVAVVAFVAFAFADILMLLLLLLLLLLLFLLCCCWRR